MKTYNKGARGERELIKFFSSHDFCVIRAAGSGFKSPDLLIFKKGLQYAIESKFHEKENLRIKKEQFLGLKKWLEMTGITPLIAWKRKNKGWLFLPLSIFKENEKGFTISWEKAKLIGMKKEELIR